MLTHPENNKRWLTVAYENLLSNPQFEYKRLLKVPAIKCINSEQFDKPSMTNTNFVNNSFCQTSKWTKVLSKKQINNILDIINSYGISAYSEQILPDLSKLGY